MQGKAKCIDEIITSEDETSVSESEDIEIENNNICKNCCYP